MFDDALVRLHRYLLRDEAESFRQAFEQFVEATAAALAVDQEEALQLLMDRDVADVVTGVLTEDVATRRGADGQSAVDRYLKRAGWRETPSARQFLEGLGRSEFLRYDVVDVRRNEGVTLRGANSGDDGRFVHESEASRQIHRGDRIAARVIELPDRCVLSGALLVLPSGGASSGRALAANATPMHLLVDWIRSAVDVVPRAPTQWVNTEGDVLVQAETLIELTDDARELAPDLIDELDGIERDGAHGWIWFGEDKGRKRARKRGSRTVRGTVRIEKGVVCVRTNSRERQHDLAGLMQFVLWPYIRRCVTEFRDVEGEAGMLHAAPASDAPQLSPAEIETVVHDTLRRHYEQTLMDRIPALGNRTPRQALRRKAGEAEVRAWLSYLQEGERKRAASQNARPLDLGWMWERLGLKPEVDAPQ